MRRFELILPAVLWASASLAVERFGDEDLERFLSSVSERVESFADALDASRRSDAITTPEGEMPLDAYLDALVRSAEAMRESFDEDDTAGDEAVSFLRHAHALELRAEAGQDLFGAEAEWAELEASLTRLADVYGVDRSLEPPLWRSLRMNDSEVVRVLESLESVAGPFERELGEVSKLLDPCTIMGTEREDVLASAGRLDERAEALREAVERGRDTSAELDALLAIATELRDFLERHSITRVLRPTWGPVERDLSLVERAFGTDRH